MIPDVVKQVMVFAARFRSLDQSLNHDFSDAFESSRVQCEYAVTQSCTVQIIIQCIKKL